MTHIWSIKRKRRPPPIELEAIVESETKPRYTESEKATCERKRRYTDEPQARAFAATLANNTEGRALFVYRCKVCGGWHLTKRPNGTPATLHDPFAIEMGKA